MFTCSVSSLPSHKDHNEALTRILLPSSLCLLTHPSVSHVAPCGVTWPHLSVTVRNELFLQWQLSLDS